MKKYEFFDHTADVGMKAFGRTRKELFSNAAEGMFSIITETDAVKNRTIERISVQENGYDMLIREWLSCLLTVYNLKDILLKEFYVKKISRNHVEAEAVGEKFDETRHSIKSEIKNVTYHNLSVKKKNGLYVADVIFDV